MTRHALLAEPGPNAAGKPATGSTTGRSRIMGSKPELGHGRMWTAAVEAVWRDDAMPQPCDLDGLELLSRLGIDLDRDATRYVMTLVVQAEDLASACQVAFGDWRLLTDLAGLPRWEPVSITSRELAI